MKRIQPWKATVFTASLWVIAIVINYAFGTSASFEPKRQPSQSPTAAYSTPLPTSYARSQTDSLQPSVVSPSAPEPESWPPPQKSAEELALERARIEHTNLLARYREPGLARHAGKHMVAIVVGTEDGKMSRAIAAAIAQKLSSPQVKIATSVFTPQFFADGLLHQAIDDAPAIAQKLDLTEVLDSIVVGRESIEYSTDASVENLISASIKLEVSIFSLRTQDSQSWTFTASGAGFKQTEARQMAEERLAKQISRDTKLALNL